MAAAVPSTRLWAEAPNPHPDQPASAAPTDPPESITSHFGAPGFLSARLVDDQLAHIPLRNRRESPLSRRIRTRSRRLCTYWCTLCIRSAFFQRILHGNRPCTQSAPHCKARITTCSPSVTRSTLVLRCYMKPNKEPQREQRPAYARVSFGRSSFDERRRLKVGVTELGVHLILPSLAGSDATVTSFSVEHPKPVESTR